MRTFILLFILFISYSCIEEKKNERGDSSSQAISSSVQSNAHQTFPFPPIPVLLTQPEERKDFLLSHYWDAFDFSDTLQVNNKDIIEQGFANYISLIQERTTTKILRLSAIQNFCSRMHVTDHSYTVCMSMVEDYLFNPNSPYYDELLYADFLDNILKNKEIDDLKKSTVSFKLDLILKNQPGNSATDFIYYTSTGVYRRLSDTPVNGNRLLLVFYDPECPSCHQIMTRMIHDERLSLAVKQKRVTVLAVYTEGNLDAWKNNISHMPADWIVAHDNMVIKDKALYDLKAMPSLYLLDRNKKVILKDASASAVLKALY